MPRIPALKTSLLFPLLMCAVVAAAEGIQSDNKEEVIAAAKTLGVFKLRTLANDKDPKSRLNAIWALGQMGEKAKDAIPTLVAASKDKDPKISAEAKQALERINSSVAAAKAPPPLSGAEAARARIDEHWKTVKITKKPESMNAIQFVFTPSDDKVSWVATVKEGIVKYRSFDIYFYKGNLRINESITILENMKRDTSKVDYTIVNPLDVTRIEILQRLNQ